MKSIMLFSVFMLPLFINAQQDIGVELYSFRNQLPKDVAGTLQKINEMGIKKLEGGSTYGLSIDSFKKILTRYDMKVISVAADYAMLENNIDSIIANAKAFGARYVVCFWIPHKDTIFTINETEKAIAIFNKAGKILKENGLTFCYHPHGYEFRPYNNQTLFDYMVNKLDKRYVNFEMDVFWIKHPGQNPVALLKKYPARFLLMHLKDRKHGTPGNQNGQADVETNVVLGMGDVGIAPIMKVAKKYGVKEFFIEDESSRSMEQVPQSLQFLKSLKQ